MHPTAHDTTTSSSTTRPRGRKLLAAGATTAALALLATGFGYQQLNEDTVTLSLDGEAKQVSTDADTVGEVLGEAGVELSDRDVVAPEPDTRVEDGTRIAVRFSRPLTVNLDGEKTRHWVTATDVTTALDQIGVRTAGADLSVSRGAEIDRSGMAVTVATPKRVTFAVGGKKPVTRTVAAITVKEALRDGKFKIDNNDVVRPKRKTVLDGSERIVVTKVRVQDKYVDNEKVSNKTETRRDSSMYEGKEKVVTKGHDGRRDVTYRLRYENGKLVDRKVLRQGDHVAPVNRVVAVGTKEKPAPAPAPAPQPADAPEANFAGGSTVWDQLAQCESGGNWAINTGNGYYGGLQFNLGTWQAYGGSGLPSDNSRAAQIAVAERLRAATGGYGSWPHCSSQLGLPR